MERPNFLSQFLMLYNFLFSHSKTYFLKLFRNKLLRLDFFALCYTADFNYTIQCNNETHWSSHLPCDCENPEKIIQNNGK